MERKEKIQALIKIREKSISKEVKDLNEFLTECNEEIYNSVKKLVERIYSELTLQANNPYQEELTEKISLSTIALDRIFYNMIQMKGKTEFEIMKNKYKSSWILANINKEGLYSVNYKESNYLIYIDELENILNEYGLEFKPIENDDCFTYEIKVNLKDYTLKY